MATDQEIKPRKPKVEPPTRWSGWVHSFKDKARTESGCSWSIAGDTLPELMADIVRQSTFALSLAHYATFTVDGLERYCAKCGGMRSIPKKGRILGRRIRCPACRGIGIFERIDSFPIECHSNAQVVPDYYISTDPYAKPLEAS
jgi:hypothetical protein